MSVIPIKSLKALNIKDLWHVIFKGLAMMKHHLNQINMDETSNTHLGSQACHQLSLDWQWPMPHGLSCFWMLDRKLMQVFLDPAKICIQTTNEPERISVLILQEHDGTTFQQNWNFIEHNIEKLKWWETKQWNIHLYGVTTSTSKKLQLHRA
jgi:hypothetical protein